MLYLWIINHNELIKINQMKKFILSAFLVIFTMSAFAIKADPKSGQENPVITDNKENKLSDEEISRLTSRVEEIRDMDKTDLTIKEVRELKKEMKGIKENVKRNNGVIYIGTGTLILIIILVILLV